MKYDCDKREDYLSSWHSWFAWYPVRVARNDCRWMERVWRKGKLEYCSAGFIWNFEHKPIQ